MLFRKIFFKDHFFKTVLSKVTPERQTKRMKIKTDFPGLGPNIDYQQTIKVATSSEIVNTLSLTYKDVLYSYIHNMTTFNILYS